MKRFLCISVLAVVTLFLGAPLASGQALDGRWIEVKVNAKGYAFWPHGLFKASASFINYIRLTWNDVDSQYQYAIYRQDGALVDQADETAFSPDLLEFQETARDVGMTFAADDVNYIQTWHTSLIKIKRDSQGALKSATFTSLGCEFYDGEIGGNSAFGGCTIKGKVIPYPPFT